jgi:hypothetical protein
MVNETSFPTVTVTTKIRPHSFSSFEVPSLRIHTAVHNDDMFVSQKSERETDVLYQTLVPVRPWASVNFRITR